MNAQLFLHVNARANRPVGGGLEIVPLGRVWVSHDGILRHAVDVRETFGSRTPRKLAKSTRPFCVFRPFRAFRDPKRLTIQHAPTRLTRHVDIELLSFTMGMPRTSV